MEMKMGMGMGMGMGWPGNHFSFSCFDERRRWRHFRRLQSALAVLFRCQQLPSSFLRTSPRWIHAPTLCTGSSAFSPACGESPKAKQSKAKQYERNLPFHFSSAPFPRPTLIRLCCKGSRVAVGRRRWINSEWIPP